MSPATPIQVLVVEDNTSYRSALIQTLADTEDLDCQQGFSTSEAAMSALAVGPAPDVILLDLGLPGKGGLEAIPEFKAALPNVHILVLTQFDDKPKVVQAIAAGVSGYLLKTSSLEEIVAGIREVMAGGSPLNAQIARMILTTFRHFVPKEDPGDLTDRERDVLALLAEGLIKKEVADRLAISFHTVDSHVRSIYRKLQVRNLSAALRKAMRQGLI